MNKKLKLILLGIFLLIFFYLALYFVLNYNSNVVYTFSLNNEDFTLKDGIFIKTRNYYLMQLGILESTNKEEQNKNYRIELYSGDNFIVGCFSELLGNYLIKEKVGNNEYFTKDVLKNFKDNFKIKIYIPNEEDINCYTDEDKCTIKTYKLDVVEEFKNNNLL